MDHGEPGKQLGKNYNGETRYEFRRLNAVSAGVKDIRVNGEAQNYLLNPKGKIILFFTRFID